MITEAVSVNTLLGSFLHIYETFVSHILVSLIRNQNIKASIKGIKSGLEITNTVIEPIKIINR